MKYGKAAKVPKLYFINRFFIWFSIHISIGFLGFFIFRSYHRKTILTTEIINETTIMWLSVNWIWFSTAIGEKEDDDDRKQTRNLTVALVVDVIIKLKSRRKVAGWWMIGQKLNIIKIWSL